MLNMKKCKKINKISKVKYLFNKNNEYFSDFNKRNGIEYIYLDIKNNKNVEEFLKNIKIKYAKEEYYSTNYIVDKKGKIYCMLKENIISYHTNNNIENLNSVGVVVLSNNMYINKKQSDSLRKIKRFLSRVYKKRLECRLEYKVFSSIKPVKYYEKEYSINFN